MVEASGAELPNADEKRLAMFRRMLAWAYVQRNTKFAVACLYAAFGWAEADGLSLTEQAKRCSVGKAAVSKVCRIIVERFNIRPSRYMMSEESANRFKLSNRRPFKIG